MENDNLNDKPYVDFMFLGMKSFIEQLDQAGTEYTILEDKNTDLLIEEKRDVFNKDTDTIKTGRASRGDKDYHFIEFGLKITPNIISYIVFLFYDLPSLDDMRAAADDIEPLVKEYLDAVGMPGPEKKGGKE